MELDAHRAREAKAGAPTAGSDPRTVMMVQECFRHSKAVGAWGSGADLLEEAGVHGAPGVVVESDGASALAAVSTLMSNHRVWERFPVPGA